MPDICVIYASEDRNVVSRLVKILSDKWDVWWDQEIDEGNWEKHTKKAIANSRCVVPVWSARSVNKDIVTDEANLAKKLGKSIYPFRIDEVDLPLGHGSLNFTDAFGWRGASRDPCLIQLIAKLERGLASSIQPGKGTRPTSLRLNEKDVRVPCFLRSVSSFETQLRPDACVTALELQQADAVLVSAYDMAHFKGRRKIQKTLSDLQARGALVVLDSGNYEAFRMNKLSKRDRNAWSREHYVSVLKRVPYDFAFCFDNLRPRGTAKTIAWDAICRTREDQDVARNKQVCPIIHIPEDKTGRSQVEMLPEIFLQVAEKLQPLVVAVAERELGDGIIERATVVATIRKALRELDWYQPIHLLGTGNPLSIAIFSAAGADMFDGLEWCRTVADDKTGLLYHYQQYDFFRYQTRLAASPIVRAWVDHPNVSFAAKAALHNLEFLSNWMREVQERLHRGTIDRFLAKRLPNEAFDDLAKKIPDVFG